MATYLTFPRETVEFLPVTITVKDADGVPVDDPVYALSIVTHGARPTTWVSPPVLISGYSPGYYDVYSKVTDSPETPVNLIGTFIVS